MTTKAGQVTLSCFFVLEQNNNNKRCKTKFQYFPKSKN
ncbi:MAG: hypothetical protein OFPI_01630 [Osedax symbiont Rs2]|nr:MAG: hypothetical protein OFPI_01630 [Osedax symbiont Rs2]